MTISRDWQRRLGLDGFARLSALVCLLAGVLVLNAAATPQGRGVALSDPRHGVAASDPLTLPTLPTRDGVRITVTEVRRAAMRADLASLLGGSPSALAVALVRLPDPGAPQAVQIARPRASATAGAAAFDARAPPAAS
jgi:hypothetical protein